MKPVGRSEKHGSGCPLWRKQDRQTAGSRPGAPVWPRQTLEGENERIAAVARRNSCFLMRRASSYSSLAATGRGHFFCKGQRCSPKCRQRAYGAVHFVRASRSSEDVGQPKRSCGRLSAQRPGPAPVPARLACMQRSKVASARAFLATSSALPRRVENAFKARRKAFRPQTEWFAAKPLPLPPCKQELATHATPPKGFKWLLCCGSPADARRPSCS